MSDEIRGAEQYVIAGVIRTDGRALDDLTLTGADFDDLRLGEIFDQQRALRAEGIPVTFATLAERIDNERAVLVSKLMDDYFDASSTGYHAEIVHEHAVRRRVNEAGMRVQQWARELTIDDLAAKARKEIDDALGVQKRQVRFMHDTLASTVQSIGQPSPAFPTPWGKLTDTLGGGFRPGALYVIGARPGVGKALALDTPLPTPTGWTTMGDVQVGDSVIGMDGKPAKVTFATPVQVNRECFEVEFSDGEVIVADAEHLWLTETRACRRAATPPGGYVFKRNSPFSRDQRHKAEKPSVKTTREILDTLRVGKEGRVNHSVPTVSPMQLPDAVLPVDPYVLGYWLGDGTSSAATFAVGDQDVDTFLTQMKRAGYHATARLDRTCWMAQVSTSSIGYGPKKDTLAAKLRELGVLGNKHIPTAYLRASETQRRDLLAGLLDSDGTASRVTGRVAFAVTRKQLAEGALELIRSLGYRATMTTKRVKGRTEESSVCFTVGFQADRSPFRLERKAALVRAAVRAPGRRYIVDVRPVASVPVRCIQVDNVDHMYLAGRAMVPTHNTSVSIDIALTLAKYGNVSYSSLEMPERELHFRAMSVGAWIHHAMLEAPHPLPNWAAERLDQWQATQPMRIAFDDRGTVTVNDIRTQARSVARLGKLSGVVVDYLQLISGSADQRRLDVVTEASRQLKLLARDLECPVIALSQLNRASESRADRMPALADLRESGAIEQDADVVMLLHRELQGGDSNQIDLIVAKNRHGATQTLHAEWHGEFMAVQV